jgi:hypothetical protein
MTDRLTDDRIAILDVIAQLAYLADNCPASELQARYLPHFSDDAEWNMNNPAAGISEHRKGHDDILAGVAERRAAGRQGPDSNVRHLITTVTVDLDGSDEASSKAYSLLLGDTNKTPTVRGLGHYSDEFRRIDGRWRVTCRTIVFE